MAEPTSAADNQILKPHSNAIVPHKIANHDTEAVQLNVWNGTEWVNIYDDNDMRNMNIDLHKVSKVVEKHAAEIPAVESAANSAVEQAESAVSASKVNSEAIAAQSEAVSEAKSAISSANAAIQQTAANAASDAAKIRADVAQMQSEIDTNKTANSASVEALKSDVSAAKQDIQAARQANENAAKQLDDYTKQAQAQGKTIKDIQNAQDGYTATLADVKGNVSKISDAVDGLSASLKDDQDNVATIKAKADELSATLTDHDKNIAQLTASAKELSSTLEDADGRLSKVEQTAATLTNEFADQQGHLNRVEQTAQGTQQTVANQQGQINTIKTDATGIHETLTGQGNQIATINVTLDGLKSKYEGVSGDLNKLKNGNYWKTVNGAFDANQYTQTAHIFYQDMQAKNTPDPGWFYFLVEAPRNDRVTQTLIKDNSENSWSRFYNGTWSAWAKGATQLDIDSLSDKININSTQITQNKKEIDLKADQSTLNNLTGEVSDTKAQLKVQADKISSKVSSEDFKTLDDKVGGAIAKIQKNSTAIDQNNKQISLKADQTEVDKIKGTASKNSSRLDVMAGEIKSKVTSTDVNNIVDKKGYATTSTVQSLITQKAGTINESIVKLDQSVKTGAENNVQLVRKSDFEDGDKGSWSVQAVVATDPPAELGQSGIKVLQTNVRDAYENDVWYSVKPGEKFDVDFWCKPSSSYDSQFGLEFGDKNKGNNNWIGVYVNKSDQWKHYTGTITAPTNATFARPWFQMNKDASNTTDTALLAKPSIRRQNATTVAAIQQITASIDGLQSNVANKADKSQITQLSNVIQSKVSASDFNNLRKAVDLQTLDSADINNMKTNGHYFVRNLANNPVGGWVYVDVTGNGADRIRQDIYQDSGNQHKYRRWFGTYWTGWEEGATESEITQLRDDINLRVKSGDLLSQINIQAGHTLIQSNKIYFDADSFVMSPNSKAFIPSAFITNLSADKITTGTLDASKLHVKNFSANDITTGTLTGIDISASDSLGNLFDMQGSKIKWFSKGFEVDKKGKPDDNGIHGVITVASQSSYDFYQGPNTTPYRDTIHFATDKDFWFTTGTDYEPDKDAYDSGIYAEFGMLGKSESDGNSPVGFYANTSRNTFSILSAVNGISPPPSGFGVEFNTINGMVVNLRPDNWKNNPGTGDKHWGYGNQSFNIQKDDHIGAYFGQGDNGNQINFAFGGDGGGFNVNGPLHVTGSKNSIVETKQGYLAINAYETAEYYFGDIGENNTGDTSQVVIGIDRIFNEVVNTDIQYQVFVTPYSNAHVWVEKRYNNRFIVKSDRPNAEFGWELKAKRKGYESNRLRRVNVDFNQMDLKGEN